MLTTVLLSTLFVAVGIFCITFFIQENGKAEGFGEILAVILFLAFGSFCEVMAAAILITELLEKVS